MGRQSCGSQVRDAGFEARLHVGTQEVSREYLSYLHTEKAQRLAAEYGYRPSDETILKEYGDTFDLNIRLHTIKDYGGWENAYKMYFDDGAMFDEIYDF